MACLRPGLGACCALVLLVGEGASVRCAMARPYASSGIEVCSQINLTTLGAPRGNSCWGYTSPSGREYAIMGVENKVAFVEVTSPRAPVIRATVAHSSSQWAEIKVYQKYAYVVNESGGGMQVIDMTNIDAGSVTLVRSVTADNFRTAHTLAMDEVSGYAYPCGSYITGVNGGLAAYSLADPSNPTLAGMWNNRYVHEAQVVTYTTGPYAGRQIAFCSCGFNDLCIVDVTNKAAMFTIACITYPNQSYTHQGWLSPDRKYFYVNDELDGPPSVPNTLTRVFDVSVLETPTMVSTFTSGAPTATDHNLHVHGRYIYESNYTSGLRVFDATNPMHPFEVAWVDTYPENNSLTRHPEDHQGNNFSGTWSNYPFFASGTVIISDINRGLFVVRPTFKSFIDFPIGLPERIEPGPGSPTKVTMELFAIHETIDPESVVLHSRIDGGAESTVEMVIEPYSRRRVGYRAALPVAPCGSTVSYYISARTKEGTPILSPASAPDSVYSAAVYSSKTVNTAFDMETDAGWTVDVADTAAASGRWQRGDPEETTAQPGDDHSDPGVNCWVTGRPAGTSIGSFDVDGGTTTLLSPIMNLAGLPLDTRIGYWRWYSNTDGTNPITDTMLVSISDNGGIDWVTVETVGPTGLEVYGGWARHEFVVADKVALTGSVRMRFAVSDAGGASNVEAALDDLEVFRYECAGSRGADFDGSGEVTIRDAMDFLQAYFESSPEADIDGVGGVNSEDVFEFVATYLAG